MTDPGAFMKGLAEATRKEREEWQNSLREPDVFVPLDPKEPEGPGTGFWIDEEAVVVIHRFKSGYRRDTQIVYPIEFVRNLSRVLALYDERAKNHGSATEPQTDQRR